MPTAYTNFKFPHLTKKIERFTLKKEETEHYEQSRKVQLVFLGPLLWLFIGRVRSVLKQISDHGQGHWQ